jgi:ankyrin repeat protein
MGKTRFQWVSLQIAQLLELLPRERDIRKRLGKLPKTLNEAYDEIYAGIQAQEGSAPDIANRVFQWVMCSCAPLSAAELVAAVCQDPETDLIDSVDIDISYILDACHNLLVIDQQLGVCRLSHLSVQEYLEDHRWSHSQANTLVAKVCLILLNSPVQQGSDPQSINEQGGNGISSIFQYARLHWATHVQKHDDEINDDRLSALLMHFLGSINESGPAYRRWYKTITDSLGKQRHNIPLQGVYRHLRPPTLASFAICAFGFHKILPSWWISGFANVNQRNDNGESLLQLTAMLGFASITQELLMKKADINTEDDDGWTALHSAAKKGHEAVVRLLLDYHADVNAKNNNGWTALHSAARKGHEAVVQLLLKHQANANATNNYGWTVLHSAARRGQEAVVRLLLDHQADINAENNSRQTALHYVAESGHEAVVQLLLDHQAKVNVNAKDDNGWTALHYAAESGHEAVVQLLLDHQAKVNVNAKDDDGWTALHYSAGSRHEAVVRLLLDHHADVNAKSNNRWTALHSAAGSGHEAVVQLLLDHHADVNAKDDDGWTALHSAARKGHETVVQLLQISSDPSY